MENVAEILRDFKDSNVDKNWDLITLKFLFTSSISIFFSKFTQILNYNFAADAIAIGCATSYMNGLGFVCPFLTENIKEKYELTKFSLIQKAFITLLLSLLFACYAPTFSLYLFFCIPLILSRCYLGNIWVALFATRKNPTLNRINESIGIMAGLTIPILFGIVCNQIGHHAVVLFSVAPVVFSLFVLYKRTIWDIVSNDESGENPKNKDD